MKTDDDREHALRMKLTELQRNYMDASQPIIDALKEIDAKKPQTRKLDAVTHYLPAHMRGMQIIDWEP